MTKNDGNTDAYLRELVKLMRKNNAMLADISKKLDRIMGDGPKLKIDPQFSPEDEAIQEKALEAIKQVDNSYIPKLNDNEKTLEICHVVKDGTKYTFNNGKLIEETKATPLDCYLYRNA